MSTIAEAFDGTMDTKPPPLNIVPISILKFELKQLSI
jgi:hypothetical protein